MNVFALQLMYVLMQSQVYSVMNTSGYKVCTEVEPLHSQPILPVLLLDTTNLDLDEEELDNMQVDQTASADTLMVADLAQSGQSTFPRRACLLQFAPLKILFPGTTYTVSERRRSNPYLALLE